MITSAVLTSVFIYSELSLRNKRIEKLEGELSLREIEIRFLEKDKGLCKSRAEKGTIQIKALKDEVKELKENLETKEMTVNERNGELGAKLEELIGKDNQLREQSEQLSLKNGQIEKLEGTLSLRESEIQSLKRNTALYKSRAEEGAIQIEELKDKVEKLQENLETQKTKLRKLGAKMKKLIEKYNQLREQSERIQELERVGLSMLETRPCPYCGCIGYSRSASVFPGLLFREDAPTRGAQTPPPAFLFSPNFVRGLATKILEQEADALN